MIMFSSSRFAGSPPPRIFLRSSGFNISISRSESVRDTFFAENRANKFFIFLTILKIRPTLLKLFGCRLRDQLICLFQNFPEGYPENKKISNNM